MRNLGNESGILDLFSKDFEPLLKVKGRVYVRKIEPIMNVRRVEVEEVIRTVMSDGTLESTRNASPGDWVILGPQREQYVVSDEKLNDLYTQQTDGGILPKERKIIALKNPVGTKIKIKAPWGSEVEPAFQEGGGQCFIVVNLDTNDNWTKDRYIIGNESLLLSNYSLLES